jgi:hypothetical protein
MGENVERVIAKISHSLSFLSDLRSLHSLSLSLSSLSRRTLTTSTVYFQLSLSLSLSLFPYSLSLSVCRTTVMSDPCNLHLGLLLLLLLCLSLPAQGAPARLQYDSPTIITRVETFSNTSVGRSQGLVFVQVRTSSRYALLRLPPVPDYVPHPPMSNRLDLQPRQSGGDPTCTPCWLPIAFFLTLAPDSVHAQHSRSLA